MSLDLTDKLFQSIDTIVSSRIESLPYDQTIECYITDNSQASDGIYRVKYQNAEFEAVSDNTSFKMDERVYVQIPQGDFDEDKIIIRKKQLEDIKKVKKLPLLSMAKSKNLFTTQQNEEVNTLPIDMTETVGKKSFFWNNEIYAGYTKLGIKVSIMTSIPYTMLSGDYGLKIEITNFDQSITPIDFKNAEKHIDTYYLKIEDMIGANLYNTNGYQNQEKVIDITNKVISAIKVSFWQDGKFNSKEYGPVINQYISYTNLQLYIGYDISDFQENKQLFLYSEDGLQYSANNNSRVLKTRLLELDKSALTFKEDSTFFVLDNTTQMYWGKYNVANNTISNIYNLLAYETVNTSRNFTNIVELSTIRSKMQEQFICAIGANNGKILYRSNILTFKNATYLAASNILDIITGLQAIVEEDNGIYQFYGQDNIATNKIAVSTPHYLVLTYLSSNVESTDNGIRAGDKIVWKIPKQRSMIIAPRLNIEYRQTYEGEGCVTDDDSYWIITQNVISSDIDTAGAYRIPFYINDYYSPQNTNNTIICQLQRGLDIYETSKELLFGTSGSQGNEYNFRLRMWQYDNKYQDGKKYVNAYYLTSNSNEPYFIEAEIYDYDNNKIDISEIQYKILYNNTIDQQFSFDISSNNSFLYTDKDTNILYNLYSHSNIQTAIKETTSIIHTPYACIKRISNSDNLLDYFSNVIEASVIIADKEYKSYLPIAVSNNEAYQAISGSTVITYDITGKKPFYTKTPFKIQATGTVANINWYIYPLENTDNFIWQPKLSSLNEEKELIPPTIYKKNSNQKFAIVCTSNNTPIWIQPIHIIQNKYPGAMENGESNYTFVNETEYVVHNMVGRISENTENNMSGLFIGVLGNNTTNTETFGLYAFKQGQKFFCVDEEGYLYLDGGLDQNSRIANVTLGNCKLEDNLFEFTEGPTASEDNVDVILIKDNSTNHNPTIVINSSGSINANTYSFNTLSSPSLIAEKSEDRIFDINADTAYFYGTAAYAENIRNDNDFGLIKDLKKIQAALRELGKNIAYEWVPN